HALRKYREIIENAYGIILDRSLLAADKDYETLPRLQKNIIEECNKHGKPAIVGSQLLESMNKNRFPSKAEVYDIANAVLDKVACLMLSDETESGKYPIEATETIAKIIKNVETHALDSQSIEENQPYPIASIFEEDKPASIDAILIITSGGYTARVVSSKRPKCRIIAATSSKKIFRQLNILWGVEPLFIDADLEDISNEEKKEAILKALKKGFIKKTDQIAIIASVFHSKSKRANLFEAHRVNEFLDYAQNKSKINSESERYEREARTRTKIAEHI
ncbi:MAG: pyruvate kinase, partial [Nanoarchaeota archaeon]